MNDENEKWIAFLLRDKYSSAYWKQTLKKQILKKFNKKNSDIYYFSSQEDLSLIYYFFVKEDNKNDLRSIWQGNVNFFESFQCHVKVSELQLNNMKQNIKTKEFNNIKYGDIVYIKKGDYSKLYGIVLRKNRVGKFDVGFKFCFGNVIKSYSVKEIKVVDNIFNYVKVLN